MPLLLLLKVWVSVKPELCVEPLTETSAPYDRAYDAADHGLRIQRVGEADVRTEALVPEIGQRAGADAARAGAGEQHRAGNAARGRIRRGGREVGPAVVQAGGRQVDVPAQARG